jgi:hypothetical protein
MMSTAETAPYLPLGDPRLRTTAVRPFVPGGRDFEASKRFYKALGFTMTFEDTDIAGFACDSGGFLLSNAAFEGWADNFMMHPSVADLDAWWEHIQALDLAATYGVRPPTAPALQPWGLTISYVVDPCGVLWHLSQAR